MKWIRRRHVKLTILRAMMISVMFNGLLLHQNLNAHDSSVQEPLQHQDGLHLSVSIIETLRIIALLAEHNDAVPALRGILENVERGCTTISQETMVYVLEHEAPTLLEKYHVKISDDEQLQTIIDDLDKAYEAIISHDDTDVMVRGVFSARKIFGNIQVLRAAEIGTLYVDLNETVAGDVRVYGGLSVNENTNLGGSTTVNNLVVNNTIALPNNVLPVRVLNLIEDPSNGTDAISLQAPAALASSFNFVLPPDTGTPGWVLTTDGIGDTFWAPTSGSGFVVDGGNIVAATLVIGTLNNFGLNFITDSISRIQISNSGVVSLPGLNSAGVVHTDVFGDLSTSLIVNNDITNGTITDAKLATITTAGKVANSATTATSSNTPNTIVARDGSGNFAAGTITASLSGAASLNVLKAGDTMTGNLVMGNQSQLQLQELLVNGTNVIGLQAPASFAPSYTLTLPTNTGTANQVLTTDGTGVLSWTSGAALPGVVVNGGNTVASTMVIGTLNNFGLHLITNGSNGIDISNTGTVTIPNLSTTGVVHNDATGLLTTSLIVNADVSASAAITDSKLTTISTAGKVANSATTATSTNTANAIVARDGSGNFAAGTITANLIGAASLNVLKTGDTMTGNLVMGNQSQIQLQELTVNGTSTITLQAPASFTPSYVLTLPVNAGNSNQVLTTDGTGVLSWTNRGTGASFITQGGNDFGATMTIGETDNFGFTIITNNTPRLQISSTGALNFDSLASAGVLHTSATGLVSTSLIVNNDITNGTITDVKLATISTAGKVANSATTATSANTANAIVARDASGNFSAGTITANLIGNVTGSASLNVLKSGDTMTGNLVMGNQSQVQFQELLVNGTNTVGVQAPALFGPSYTLTLPTNTGTANQVLTTDGTGVLSWQAAGSLPNVITQGGNAFGATMTIGEIDNFGFTVITNNTPRLQISNAGVVTVANLAGTGNRIVQTDASGDLSAVLPTGIQNVIQVIANSPTVVGEYYSDIKSAVDYANANATVPTAIVVGAGIFPVTATITVTNQFLRSISGSFASKIVPVAALAGSPMFVFAQTGALEPFEFRELVIDGAGVVGWKTTSGSIGVQVTGAGQFSINRTVALNCYQSFVAIGGVGISQSVTLGEVAFGLTGDCVVLADNGTNLIITNSILIAPTTQLVQAQQSNVLAPATTVIMEGGKYTNDISFTGTGILAKDTASVTVAAGFFRNLQNIFVVQDNASIQTLANISVNGSVTNYEQLTGTATLNVIGDFVHNAFDDTKYVVTNSANVLFDIIDAATGDALTGRFTDADNQVLTFLNGHGSNNPSLNYINDWFGYRGDALEFPQASLAGVNGGMRTINTENMDATFMALVTGATAHSNNALVSLSTYQSTSSPDSPDLSLLRTWQLEKQATTHNYVMNFWNGADYTQYFTLTPTGNLGLGTATPNSTLEIGTGQIAVPSGTAANPSYAFSSNLDTGMYSPADDTLSMSSAGLQRLSISPTGIVSINNLTPAGVVHNDASGNLSTSLIVGADIATGTITDDKLATITTAGKVANSATTATSLNTPNTIVLRDGSGNFAAGTITANLMGNVTGNVTGAASLNVLKSGDTMTGSLILSGAGTNLTVGGTTDVQALNVNGNLHALSTTTFDQGVPGVQQNVLQVTTGPISGPNQFNSIVTAVNSITTNSSTNPFIVQVGPGVFTETTITLKPFVSLVGYAPEETIIQASSPAQNVIVGSVDSSVENVTLTGATNAGAAAVVFSGGSGDNFVLNNCIFGSNDILVNQTATVAPASIMNINNCTVTALSQFTTGVSVVANGPDIGAAYIDGLLLNPLANSLFSQGIFISGPAAFGALRNITIIGSNTTPVPGNAVVVQNGAEVALTSAYVVGFTRGLWVPNVGTGPFLSVLSLFEDFNTEDIRIDNPATTGSLDGTFNRLKVFINSSSAISVFFLDPLMETSEPVS